MNRSYMQKCVFVSVVISLTVAPISVQAATGLTPSDFWEKIQTAESALIIDARGATDYEAKHIPSAINIQYQGSVDANSLQVIRTFNPSLILIYCDCPGGSNAVAMAQDLEAEGIENIFYLAESFAYWPYATVSADAPGTLEKMTSLPLTDPGNDQTTPGPLMIFIILDIIALPFLGIYLFKKRA